jgi:RNA polymerase sigma-70 factor, ECF subfamily
MTETSHSAEARPGARDDTALVEAMAAGDRDAFSEAFTRHRSDVYRFARHMTGSADAADDVTQETFLALMQMPGRFDAARGTLRQYLLGIARNVVARRLRSHRWWAPVEDADRASSESNGHDPLEQLCRATDVARVQLAVQTLPTPYRDTLVLCDLLGLSYDEAASTLACPVGTVRSRLFRARQRLAVALATDPMPAAEGVTSRCLA